MVNPRSSWGTQKKKNCAFFQTAVSTGARRWNVATTMVRFKNSHIRKNLTQNGETQRCSWECRRRKRRRDCTLPPTMALLFFRYKFLLACLSSVFILLFFCLFPSYISGVHHFWVRFLRMWPFFNPTIKVVTFHLRGFILHLTFKQQTVCFRSTAK